MNPWKLATLGIVTVLVTALSTGVTTAFLMRPVPAPEPEIAAPAGARYAVATTSAPRAVAAAPAPVRATPIRRVSTASAAVSDCDTGGERAWKIAKPGLIGTLLGAGVGAAGGAIADGGKTAGKGAIIGGLAGAALGAGYGAYKTKQECGTIFGDSGLPFASGGGSIAPSRGGSIAYTNDAPRAPRATRPSSGGITVYNAGTSLPR